jgi:hypothetical protein
VSPRERRNAAKLALRRASPSLRRPLRRLVTHCRALAIASAIWGIAVAGIGCDSKSNERPDVVLITVDTLRADHLELYGYPRATAPALAALSQRGVTFERAISQAPWTLPSIASLLTSLYPSQHGAVLADTPLAEGVTTLAQVLQSSGYHTDAVVSHVFVGSRYGLDRGFDTFDEELAPPSYA